jgi:pectate lyase
LHASQQYYRTIRLKEEFMRISVLAAVAAAVVILPVIASCSDFDNPTFVEARKAAKDIPSFPGAEGPGMYTLGGRGGKVYEVTNTDDAGPGSLREACEAEGPRTVVFRTAGILTLAKPLDIRNPYITMAGQTAPGDGFCIRGQSVHVNTHDVIIRHMRFRRGNLVDRDDALGGYPRKNIIVDHVSASWGLDETLSMYRYLQAEQDGGDGKFAVENLTIQWTVISEALNPFSHAFGGTWGGNPCAFHHNLFACNAGRNPSLGMGGSFNFYNNVLFNWQHRTADGGDETSFGNFIGNYYKPGPAVNKGPIGYRILLPQGKRLSSADMRKGLRDSIREFGKWYVTGNIVEGNKKVTADNWAGGVQFPVDVDAAEMKKFRVDTPFPDAPVTVESAEAAYKRVLASSGATLPVRDAVDKRIVTEVATGTVTYKDGIITDPAQVGGWPKYEMGPVQEDSDHDGMPDAWEKANGLDPKDASDGAKDKDGDGYTNLEEFLNGTDPGKAVNYKNLKNNIDTISPSAK